MIIDITALLLVLLFGFFGYRSGLITQLFRVLSLVAGFAAAWFLTPPLSDWLARALSIDPFLAGVASFIALFFLVSLAIGLTGGALSRAIRSENAAFTFFDRGLGGLLGAVKGVALVYVTLALAWTLQPTIQQARPELDMGLESSLIAAEVRRHNVIQDEVFPRASAALKLLRLLEDRALLERAALDPPFRDGVLARADGKVLLDPALLAAPPNQRWKLLVEDGRILELLDDPAVVKLLADYDLDALRGAAPVEGGALLPLPERPGGGVGPPQVAPAAGPEPVLPEAPLP